MFSIYITLGFLVYLLMVYSLIPADYHIRHIKQTLQPTDQATVRSTSQINKQTKYQKGKPMDKTNNKSYQQKQYQRSNIITLNITH